MKRMTEATMNRDEVLSLLRAHKATLAQRFGVVELRLYGSFARNRAAGDSDVDVLVRFDAPPDWRRYFGAQAYLEDLLGRPVDMATNQELRAEIRPYVERELIDV
jgi:predicted nucleotidyltransferase